MRAKRLYLRPSYLIGLDGLYRELTMCSLSLHWPFFSQNIRQNCLSCTSHAHMTIKHMTVNFMCFTVFKARERSVSGEKPLGAQIYFCNPRSPLCDLPLRDPLPLHHFLPRLLTAPPDFRLAPLRSHVLFADLHFLWDSTIAVCRPADSSYIKLTRPKFRTTSPVYSHWPLLHKFRLVVVTDGDEVFFSVRHRRKIWRISTPKKRQEFTFTSGSRGCSRI